jgi:hypothetical protein
MSVLLKLNDESFHTARIPGVELCQRDLMIIRNLPTGVSRLYCVELAAAIDDSALCRTHSTGSAIRCL